MDQFILSQNTSRRIAEQREMLSGVCKGSGSLHEAYTRLNRSQYGHFFDGRRPVEDGWREFYNWHSDSVKGVMNGFSGSSCVLGAGPCSDLDLEYLAEASDKVTLVDMDEEAPSLARDRLPGPLKNKVIVLRSDVSGFIEGFVSAAEKIISVSSTGESAVQSVLALLSSYKRAHITPMSLDSGSMDLVISCDAVSNLLRLPLHYVQNILSEKFGDGHSILKHSEDLFAVNLSAPFFHFTEARRLLSERGIFAVSACAIHAATIKAEGEQRIFYGFNDNKGRFVLSAVPKFGFHSERHITLSDIAHTFSRKNSLIPIASGQISVPLAPKIIEEDAPGYGRVEVYPAALCEFIAFMTERIWPGKSFDEPSSL